MLDALFLIGGLLLLILGASLLVSGASRLALGFGISPLVVGLTVVAFGTSAPELFVSAGAALSGRPELAVGNVVGSSIFNILVILGLSAVITPLTVERRLVRYEVPLLLLVTALVWLLIADGTLAVGDALILCVGAVAYFSALVYFTLRSGASGAESEADVGSSESWMVSLLRVGAGLGLLVVGSEGLVQGAANLARAWGMSELMVGVVIIAAGTSLPELATSVVAAMRGERDIAVGNVVGSNLFNLLVVLGISGALSGQGMAFPAEALQLDVPVMVGAAVLCLPVVVSGARITRFEGGLLLCAFALYMTALVMSATGHQMAGRAMVVARWYVVPAVAIVLLGSLVRSHFEVGRALRRAEEIMDNAVRRSMDRMRTVVIAVTGGTLVVLGLVLFFTPLPGVLVVALGFGVLAIEFTWAKRMLVRMRRTTRRLLKRK